MKRAISLLFLLAYFSRATTAQESPFVSAELFKSLNGEISADISYEHLRHLTLYHSPNGASRGFWDKMRWILAKAKEAGLEDVRLIDDLNYKGVGWTPLSAEPWMGSPENRRLISLRGGGRGHRGLQLQRHVGRRAD